MTKDAWIAAGVTTAVLTAGLVMAATVKTIGRPDVIVTDLELPKLRPVVTIYEYGPDEDLPPHDPEFAHFADDPSPFNEDPVIRNSRIFSTEEKVCMAKNIYFEAKNQSLKGQVAVALVTLNRVNSNRYPDDVCDVVYDHQQFSWYWDGKPDNPVNPKAFEQAIAIANAILDPEAAIFDFTYGSDHYHADYVNPYWSRDSRMYRVVQIETHIFYRDMVATTNSPM